ncbi:MAG: IclR family transcriptional regulator [Parvibaculum sp.]|jgi:DNA-binding IclR family transcriptional regulator|uniref:IclR family transcriptional regulator n=1 Tax=Parvibaculum sp. TaxID=2024848 RepID=UPI00284FA544|nr:IclR family transcriptional regulator [Parvibaculum sp.]MDR3498206.1 IclR family transcriptional regulator [Parvibaculum sp.]
MAQYENSSLDKALALIERLSRERRPMSLAEIARAEGLNRSTVFGHLAVLVRHGYVRKDAEDGRYTLGHKIFRVADRVTLMATLSHAARGMFLRASSAIGETAYLSVLDGTQALVIDPAHAVNLGADALIKLPRMDAHACGAGQVLLAYRERAFVQAIYRDHPPKALTSKTPRTLRALFDLSERILADGYRYEQGEFDAASATLAVPIFANPGLSRFALAVTGPSNRLSEARAKETLPTLLALAAEIGKQMRNPDEAA